jgi:hypothetical protein
LILEQGWGICERTTWEAVLNFNRFCVRFHG